jgi:hypothetical protein
LIWIPKPKRTTVPERMNVKLGKKKKSVRILANLPARNGSARFGTKIYLLEKCIIFSKRVGAKTHVFGGANTFLRCK